MMAELDSAQLREWAVRGAEQRLQEIAAEAAAIYQAFPELRDRGGREAATSAAGGAKGRGGRRGNLSAAQRKAVSDRMRKYWAARREGAGATASAGSAKAGRGARRSTRKASGAGTRGPRKMSAAARKRISDAQKKRWADRRNAKG
jgi:hypothetical protein